MAHSAPLHGNASYDALSEFDLTHRKPHPTGQYLDTRITNPDRPPSFLRSPILIPMASSPSYCPISPVLNSRASFPSDSPLSPIYAPASPSFGRSGEQSGLNLDFGASFPFNSPLSPIYAPNSPSFGRSGEQSGVSLNFGASSSWFAPLSPIYAPASPCFGPRGKPSGLNSIPRASSPSYSPLSPSFVPCAEPSGLMMHSPVWSPAPLKVNFIPQEYGLEQIPPLSPFLNLASTPPSSPSTIRGDYNSPEVDSLERISPLSPVWAPDSPSFTPGFREGDYNVPGGGILEQEPPSSRFWSPASPPQYLSSSPTWRASSPWHSVDSGFAEGSCYSPPSPNFTPGLAGIYNSSDCKSNTRRRDGGSGLTE